MLEIYTNGSWEPESVLPLKRIDVNQQTNDIKPKETLTCEVQAFNLITVTLWQSPSKYGAWKHK